VCADGKIVKVDFHEVMQIGGHFSYGTSGTW